MIQTLFKLVAITVASLILTILALFWVRQMGLRQQFAPPPHPWFQKPFWWVARIPEENLCRPDEGPADNWILRLPVRRKGDEWVVPCAKPVAVSEYLRSHPRHDWLLDINAHDTWGLDDLVKQLSQFEDRKSFAVRADSQKVNIYLRKQAPQWLFAADEASLARFRMFESLWIETAMDFSADFVILEKNSVFDDQAVAEWRRRQKRIVQSWEPGDKTPLSDVEGVETSAFDPASLAPILDFFRTRL